jgi:hypothetical protein
MQTFEDARRLLKSKIEKKGLRYEPTDWRLVKRAKEWNYYHKTEPNNRIRSADACVRFLEDRQRNASGPNVDDHADIEQHINDIGTTDDSSDAGKHVDSEDIEHESEPSSEPSSEASSEASSEDSENSDGNRDNDRNNEDDASPPNKKRKLMINGSNVTLQLEGDIFENDNIVRDVEDLSSKLNDATSNITSLTTKVDKMEGMINKLNKRIKKLRR